MSRIAYVDGVYQPIDMPGIHVEDRGYQFADGVYEVCAVHNARPVDEEAHLDRLERSLAELGIAAPMSRAAMKTWYAKRWLETEFAMALSICR